MADFIACRANVLGNYCTKSVNLNRKRALSIVAVTARIPRRESIHVCLSSTERRSWPTVRTRNRWGHAVATVYDICPPPILDICLGPNPIYNRHLTLITLPTLSFTLGLNPSFSANPPYCSLSFFSFRFHYMDFPDCLLLLLSMSVFLLFSFSVFTLF